MNFQLIGVNHKTAPVDVREQLAIPDRKLPEALQQLLALPGVSEGMILCTCNRVEILAQTANGSADLRQFLRQYFSLAPASYEPHLYEYRENDAVRHVFRVAVRFRVNNNRLDAHLATGALNAQRDLAAVCDQDLVEQLV